MGKLKYGTAEIIASFLGIFIFVFLEWLEKTGIFLGVLNNEIYNWLQIRMIILTLVAAMFGPISGVVCGVGGSMLINVLFEYSIDYSEVIVVGLYGLALGRFYDKFKVLAGRFEMQEFIDFCAVQVAASLFSGVLLMPILAFVMEDRYMSSAIIVGIKSVVGNSVTSCFICGVIMTIVSLICKKRKEKKRAEAAKYFV